MRAAPKGRAAAPCGLASEVRSRGSSAPWIRPATLAGLLAGGIIATFALPAAAERIIVRGGEHGAFTRLVLHFEALPEWSLTPAPEGGYRLRTRARDAAFDLSEAWTRITRERIARLAPSGSDLDIALACDCVAEASEIRPRLLVIDVREDTARPSTAPVPSAPPRLLPLTVDAAHSVSPPSFDPALDGFRVALAAELGEGIERGLVTPVPGFLATPSRSATVAAGAENLAPTRLGGATPAQIRLAPSGEADPARRAEDCPDPSLLDLGAPSDGAATEAVTAARTALFGEFDRTDPAAARTLAQAYLRAGLGAEAEAALGLAALSPREADLLGEVARLMDGPPGSAGSTALEQLSHCGGSTSLFAVLARAGRPLPRTLDRGSLVGTVSGLPVALRRHLVPRLAGAFLADGDDGTARLLQASVARAPGAPSRELELLSLRLALRDDGTAAQGLMRLAEGADDVALAAAVLAFERGAPPDPGAVDVLLTERRGTAEGERLRTLAAAERWRAHDWDRAVEIASAAPRSGDPSLWDALAGALLEEPDDAVFIRAAYIHRAALDEAPIARERTEAIAGRLAALGFAASRRADLRSPLIGPIEPGSAWWPDAPHFSSNLAPAVPTGTHASLTPPPTDAAAGPSARAGAVERRGGEPVPDGAKRGVRYRPRRLESQRCHRRGIVGAPGRHGSAGSRSAAQRSGACGSGGARPGAPPRRRHPRCPGGRRGSARGLGAHGPMRAAEFEWRAALTRHRVTGVADGRGEAPPLRPPCG